MVTDGLEERLIKFRNKPLKILVGHTSDGACVEAGRIGTFFYLSTDRRQFRFNSVEELAEAYTLATNGWVGSAKVVEHTTKLRNALQHGMHTLLKYKFGRNYVRVGVKEGYYALTYQNREWLNSSPYVIVSDFKKLIQ